MRMVRANDEGRRLFRLTGTLTTTSGPVPSEVIAVVAANEHNAKITYYAVLGYVPDDVTAEDRGSADRTEIALWGDTSRV